MRQTESIPNEGKLNNSLYFGEQMIRAFVLSFCLISLACSSHIAGLRSEPEYPQAGLFSLDALSGDNDSSQDIVWPESEGPLMVEVEEFDEPTYDALKGLLPQVKDAGHKEITIRIDSYGGSVHWGMEMMQLLENSGMHIRCVVDTKAMSMGFFLLESCDERLMTKRSTLMAHEPWTRTQGNATELEETALRLRVLCESMIEVAAEKMHMSKAQMLQKINNREWHMGWEEALQVGAIDDTIAVHDLPRQFNMKIKQPSLLDLLGGSKTKK